MEEACVKLDIRLLYRQAACYRGGERAGERPELPAGLPPGTPPQSRSLSAAEKEHEMRKRKRRGHIVPRHRRRCLKLFMNAPGRPFRGKYRPAGAAGAAGSPPWTGPKPTVVFLESAISGFTHPEHPAHRSYGPLLRVQQHEQVAGMCYYLFRLAAKGPDASLSISLARFSSKFSLCSLWTSCPCSLVGLRLFPLAGIGFPAVLLFPLPPARQGVA